jgi:hypothetical protein
MNTILLHPNDVLFFRDGRPMGGSLSGHGAAWPLPSVVNQAFHAALHRAGLDAKFSLPLHGHGHVGGNGVRNAEDDRKFGSLKTAGPFPVFVSGEKRTWYFPRPLDAGENGSAMPTFLPLEKGFDKELSSLPEAVSLPVANTKPPTKKTPEPWFDSAAYAAYLGGTPESPNSVSFLENSEFCDTEFSFGIGIDPATGTQDGERFYSAHYLRLREDWRMGVLAHAPDKDFSHSEYGDDLVRALLNGSGAEIIAGGQQRICTATMEAATGAPLPLPRGMEGNFAGADGKFLVKWTLLSPAVWPEMTAGTSKRGTERKSHPGGWLPNWIDSEFGKVLLQSISKEERRRRRNLNYGGKGYSSEENASPIAATLVAAMVGKPVAVTGYAMASRHAEAGPKPAHPAVPAGSVYYFEAADEDAARKLAAALNWHGTDTSFSSIRNRRSTLMGEKGFGLGVCSTWKYHDGNIPR